MLLTAALASPFDSGLYGKASSCVMPCFEQYALNSALNCGPPSVLMCVGQPYSLKMVVSIVVTSGVAAVSYTHLRAHETPEHLVCRLLLAFLAASVSLFDRS